MRLISWNIAARRSGVDAQVAVIAERRPDVVVLQEVTAAMVPPLRRALEDAGLPTVAESLTTADPYRTPAGPRRYGLLTASRYRLRRLPSGSVPWPERLLSVEFHVDGNILELHNSHIPPGSSNGWDKVRMLEGVYATLARNAPIPRILCGDFNTPQAELPSGEVVTWAQRRRPDGGWALKRKVRGGAGAAWDAAERHVLEGLAAYDLADVFRQLHGHAAGAYSWFARHGESSIGRRFDHVFASAALQPSRCRYLDEVRQRGLSDHAAVEVDFVWPAASRAGVG